jgi:hypothetical protein
MDIVHYSPDSWNCKSVVEEFRAGYFQYSPSSWIQRVNGSKLAQ